MDRKRLYMAEKDDKKLPVYKVALCGKTDVGKTSIFRRIRGDGFKFDTSKFRHLAEDEIKIQVKNKAIKVRNVCLASCVYKFFHIPPHIKEKVVIHAMYVMYGMWSFHVIRTPPMEGQISTSTPPLIQV